MRLFTVLVFVVFTGFVWCVPYGIYQRDSPDSSVVSQYIEGSCENKISSYPSDFEDGCCGIDSSAGNKIVGGTFAAIDQYPWTALIEYVPLNNTLIKTNLFLCGGALISSTFVLTAAHCFTVSADFMKPEFVRLGEYNTTSDDRDCVAVDGGGMDCTDPVLVVKIQSYTLHPQYRSSTSANDIALIRLKNPAPFTDFIRPICLPATDITKSPPARLLFTAVGWGVINDMNDISKVKQHIRLPFVSMQYCQSRYVGTKHSPLSDHQICAGGERGRDTCKLDSGGPLMSVDENTVYQLVGIISFGPKPCGLEGVPGVYTKVHSYLPWIFNITSI